ncbi:hypothetical protein DEJ50_07670 [Streptomyces venezuelae]|uniref:Uncharacterized protein n=1 Tax=Streptomyces venezuelae TaxID=54571 RepID=A0A5P2D310_STRVZ|nr:hypothetical protein DEJ50_07670 [Streptomyces venezuelae]
MEEVQLGALDAVLPALQQPVCDLEGVGRCEGVGPDLADQTGGEEGFEGLGGGVGAVPESSRLRWRGPCPANSR